MRCLVLKEVSQFCPVASVLPAASPVGALDSKTVVCLAAVATLARRDPHRPCSRRSKHYQSTALPVKPLQWHSLSRAQPPRRRCAH